MGRCVLGEVRRLPLAARSCYDCQHFELVEDDNLNLASFCQEWQEPLDDETVAADCPDFQLSELSERTKTA